MCYRRTYDPHYHSSGDGLAYALAFLEMYQRTLQPRSQLWCWCLVQNFFLHNTSEVEFGHRHQRKIVPCTAVILLKPVDEHVFPAFCVSTRTWHWSLIQGKEYSWRTSYTILFLETSVYCYPIYMYVSLFQMF